MQITSICQMLRPTEDLQGVVVASVDQYQALITIIITLHSECHSTHTTKD